MLDKWFKKEKPVFTGVTRGVGGFGFGAAASLVPGSTIFDGTWASGGALIAMSFGVGGLFTAPLTGLGAGSFAAAGLGAKAAFGIGASLVLSGVSDMLFPQPKMPQFSSEQDPRLSFSFSGTQQTSRAGTPVPLVYGEIFTGSVVISSSIDTEQVQV